MSERAVQAVVTGGVGVAVILLVRLVLRLGFDRYLARIAQRRSAADVASLRTRLSVLSRVLVAVLAAIVVWQVLSIFPATHKLGTALLASSAVLAIFVGIAFTVPLGNLGAGILLAFSQPVRLGDRATVSEVTGEVEQITLIYTVLLTDDDRRVFVPNSQMVSSVVVNRTIKDPRRLVSVRVPVALTAPIDRARAAVLGSIAAHEQPLEDASVLLGEVNEGAGWLTVSAFAPPGSNAAALGSALREQAVAALAREQLLPSQ